MARKKRNLFMVELSQENRDALNELSARMHTSRGAVVRLGIGVLLSTLNKKETVKNGK